MQRPVSSARVAAIVAPLMSVAAVAGFGARFPAFSNIDHPVALLGASGVPHAVAFDVLAFVLPGLLAAFVMHALRARMAQAPLVARIGVQALMLAALAFAAMGLLPLDSHDLLSTATRLHAVAWTAWWIAFGAGAAMLAWGMRGTPHARRSLVVGLCAVAAVAFVLVLPGLLPVGLSQRLAFAAWFLATLRAAR